MTSKGQITIPKRIRTQLGVGPGDTVEIKRRGDRFCIEKRIQSSPFTKYLGYLKSKRGENPDRILEDLRGK